MDASAVRRAVAELQRQAWALRPGCRASLLADLKRTAARLSALVGPDDLADAPPSRVPPPDPPVA